MAHDLLLQLEAGGFQPFFDFFQGFFPDAGDLLEVTFCKRQQGIDGVDALLLEGVQHPVGKLEAFQAHLHRLLRCRFLRRTLLLQHHRGTLVHVQDAIATEYAQLVLHDVNRMVERFLRLDAAVSPDAQHQAVQLRVLSDAGVFDVVSHALYGGEHGVNGDAVDAVLRAVHVRGDVTDTRFDPYFHDELAARREGRHVQVRVHDFRVDGNVEIRGGHHARRFAAQGEGDGVTVVDLHDQVLQVEDYLHDILGDAFDGAELVQHVFDVDARHGRTGNAGQQDPPQRVAQRYAVAADEGLNGEFTEGPVHFAFEFRNDRHSTGPLSARVVLDDLQFVDGNHYVFAVRQVLEDTLHVFGVEIKPRKHLAAAAAFNVFLDVAVLAGTRSHADFIARFHVIAGNVHAGAVHHDVSMAHELTRLTAGVGDAEPVHDIVETAFEQLQEHCSRGAFPAVGFLEQVVELLFAHVVEEAQLLLFPQSDTVVTDAAAAALTVLPRRVRTALHVFLYFRRFREVHALTSADLYCRSSVIAHFSPKKPCAEKPGLHALPLARTAAVVGRGGVVDDGAYVHARSLDGTDCLFPA